MNYITSADKKLYTKKLKELEIRLEEAIRVKDEAEKHGDFSENEEYQKAKRDVQSYSLKISELREKLTYEVKNNISSTIDLGSKVKVRITDEQDNTEFEGVLIVVASDEVLPSDGYISSSSQIFEFLKGKKYLEREIIGLDNKKRKYFFELEEGV